MAEVDPARAERVHPGQRALPRGEVGGLPVGQASAVRAGRLAVLARCVRGVAGQQVGERSPVRTTTDWWPARGPAW